MKVRELKVYQEPARYWFYVSDAENEEDGVLFGPTPYESVAEAWVDGYNQALEEVGEGIVQSR